MLTQRAIELLEQLKKEIREVDSTHSLVFRGGKAIDIIEKVKPGEAHDETEFEQLKESSIESITLSLERETGWAESSYADSRKKKSKVSIQKASYDLQHAISHVLGDIDTFIEKIS